MSDYFIGQGLLDFKEGSLKKRAFFLIHSKFHTLWGDYKEIARDDYTGEIEFQLDGTLKHNHGRGNQFGREEHFSIKSLRTAHKFDCPLPAIKDISGGKLLFSSDPDDPKIKKVKFEFRFAKPINAKALAAFCT